MPQAALEKVLIKIKKINNYAEIWTSHGTSSRHKASVWVPRVVTRKKTNPMMGKNNVEIINLGHVGVAGFSNPKSDKIERFVIEVIRKGGVRDSAGGRIGLEEIVETLFPKPIKYRLVWKQEEGNKPFYGWEGIPPDSRYVCIGMIGTTSPNEPSLGEIRCVPLRWVVPTQYRPMKIWDDAGTGGKKGSFWTMSSLKTLFITEGHDKPEGIFYDIWTNKSFKASQGMF